MLRHILWKHLSHIDLLQLSDTIPQDIDIVISGGGFLGYYLVGVDRIIRKLTKSHRLEVHRYAGTSVGSLAAVAMVCDMGDNMIALYDQLQGNPHYFTAIRNYFVSILPKDAYKLCTGRVFISISEVDFTYGIPILRNRMVNEFYSNEDLVDACMASSNVPFFVSSKMFYEYRGKWCVDGGFTNNTALFHDRQRPQLTVKLNRIPYSWRSAFTPFYNLVLPLIIKGAIETELFFMQHEKTVGGALEWHNCDDVIARKSYLSIMWQTTSCWITVLLCSLSIFRQQWFSLSKKYMTILRH